MLYPYPLSHEIWEGHVLECFKSPSLAKFNGRSDSYEHVAFINTWMAIIGTVDPLKCKFLYKNFMDETLRWYMGLPQSSITSY